MPKNGVEEIRTGDCARGVVKKFGVPPQDAKEKARQMRFLQSRGFSMDVIYKAMSADAAED